MTVNDAYRILNASKTSSFAYIKNQYHVLAKKYHPDLNSSIAATEKMKELNEAWQIIIDDFSVAEKDIKDPEPADVEEEQEEDSAISNSQTTVWYVVRMYLGSGLRIPKFCPITMTRDCNSYKSINLKSVSFEPRGSKRVIMHSSRLEVPFSIKDSSYSYLLKKYVKISYSGDWGEFRFKNKEYAELFAAINDSTVDEETKKDAVLNTAKRAASSVGNLALTIFAMCPGLLLLLIILIGGQCSN